MAESDSPRSARREYLYSPGDRTAHSPDLESPKPGLPPGDGRQRQRQDELSVKEHQA